MAHLDLPPNVSKQRTRYEGYLRAGAIVDARGPGDQKRWLRGRLQYRVNPRGFVCIGLGASLNLKEAVIGWPR